MGTDEKPTMARVALQKAADGRFSDVVLTLLALNALVVFVRDGYRLPLLGIASPGLGASAVLLLLWIGFRAGYARHGSLSVGGFKGWLSAHVTDLLAAAVVVAGLVLRLAGINYGAPLVNHPDESAVIAITIGMLKRGSFDPGNHIYPTVFHYLLLPAFALYFLRGMGQGLWAEMAEVNRRDFGFYYIGRWYSAVLGAATIALVYAAAKKMWPGDRGRWAGVMAAVLLAFSFVHVRESQNAVTNAPMAFFVVVAFLAVLAVYQGGSMRSYALAGFLCGIAVATKLSALPVILSLPLAHFLGRRPGEWLRTRALVGAGMVPIGFISGYPYAVLGWVPFLETTSMVSDVHNAASIDTAARFAQVIGYFNESGMGTPFFLLTVVAIIYYVYQRQGGALLAIAVIAANVALLTHSGWTLRPRYHIVMIPFAALLVGGLLADLGAVLLRWARQSERLPVSVPERMRPALAVGIVTVLLALAVLPQARESIDYTQRRNWDDTRTLAHDFILDNVHPRTNVATEISNLHLPRPYRVIRWAQMHTVEPQRFDDRRIEIVVLLRTIDARVAGNVPAEQRRAQMRGEMELLAEFSAVPGQSMGPTVGVYRNAPRVPRRRAQAPGSRDSR